MKIVDKIKNIFKPQIRENRQEQETYEYFIYDLISGLWDGDKFPGSFGKTKDLRFIDYWQLRERSLQLFEENPYARGLLRRILRNVINKGLILEANNINEITGLDEEKAIKWDEGVEILWNLWGKNKSICDWNKQNNIGELEAECYKTALISGDCLVVLHINQKTGLPIVELIDGSKVQTPFRKQLRKGNKILHGVEIDKHKRHVAYYIKSCTEKGIEFKRVPVYGEKSGRKIAWLVYGTDKKLNDVRGIPFLAIVLYMLKDLDRYRDAELRAAVINAMFPLFIKKATAFGSGLEKQATKLKTVHVQDDDGNIRDYKRASFVPGTIWDNLQKGEEPTSFNTQRPNVNHKIFEETILDTFSWIQEMPPEIMRMSFKNNFSASRAAFNEYNIILDGQVWKFASNFDQFIYQELLTAFILIGKVQAPGFLNAYYNKNWEVIGAWLSAEWSGIHRPSVDLLKDVKAAKEALALRITTYDQQSRKISGMSFRAVLKRLEREQRLLEKSGLTSSVDETAQGEPIAGMKDLIVNMTDKMDEIENRLEEVES